MLLDIHSQYVNCNFVVPAFRHNKIGISFARFDELQVHRFEYASISFHNSLGSTSSFYDITLNDTNQAFVGVCINKYFQVHHAAQGVIAKSKDALYNHYITWFYVDGFGLTCTSEIRIGGLFDALSVV